MLAPTLGRRDRRSFLLQRAQPAMTGLIDGSLSTLAPIFAVAFATHQPHDAFLAGLATAIGAGAVICGTLFRSGPLRASESAATAAPAGAVAQQATAHAA